MSVRSLLFGLPLLLAACGSGAGDGSAFPPPPDTASFVARVDHRYFPLEPGRSWVYQGDDLGRPAREEVRTLPETRPILGVACTGIEEWRFVDGFPTETTTEWFAQDREGNVWKFGEESYLLAVSATVPTSDSWIAGVAGGRPWRAFAAAPRAGERFPGYRPDGSDVFEISSFVATVTVPAGVFGDCVELVENPDDPEDTDIILYGSRVGRLSERTSTGMMELVWTTPP